VKGLSVTFVRCLLSLYGRSAVAVRAELPGYAPSLAEDAKTQQRHTLAAVQVGHGRPHTLLGVLSRLSGERIVDDSTSVFFLKRLHDDLLSV
jgi:hypothetical protein